VAVDRAISKRSLTSATALALALAVLVAASAEGAATRAEYVAQAEPICAETNSDIARLDKRFFTLADKGLEARKRPTQKRFFRKAGGVIKETAAAFDASVAAVRLIPPPPGDEQLITQWLDINARRADLNRDRGKAFAKLRFRRAAQLQSQNVLLADEAHGLVADFGFHACVGKD